MRDLRFVRVKLPVLFTRRVERMYRVILSIFFIIVGGCAQAHPGGTDANSCHVDKKTGKQHCHKPKQQSDKKVEEKTAKVDKAAQQTEINRSGDLLKLDYQGFTVWLDCARRGAVKFRYNAQHDTGSAKRNDKFFLDPNVPGECQQTTAKAYGENYDRGHLVPANHLDSSEAAIKATNTMTNILPQAANMNRGAWLLTEEIIECYRDIDELLVIGGVIWGDNPADDYFVQSHGIKTPDAFWKVVIRGTGQNERAIAWIVPNSQDATKKNLDRYLVSVDEVEKVTGEKIPVADYVKHEKPSQSWLIPRGCNKA